MEVAASSLGSSVLSRCPTSDRGTLAVDVIMRLTASVMPADPACPEPTSYACTMSPRTISKWVNHGCFGQAAPAIRLKALGMQVCHEPAAGMIVRTAAEHLSFCVLCWYSNCADLLSAINMPSLQPAGCLSYLWRQRCMLSLYMPSCMLALRHSAQTTP